MSVRALGIAIAATSWLTVYLVAIGFVPLAQLLHLWRLKHTVPLHDMGWWIPEDRRFGWAEGTDRGVHLRVFWCQIPGLRTWGHAGFRNFDLVSEGWRKHQLIYVHRIGQDAIRQWRLEPPLP